MLFQVNRAAFSSHIAFWDRMCHFVAVYLVAAYKVRVKPGFRDENEVTVMVLLTHERNDFVKALMK